MKEKLIEAIASIREPEALEITRRMLEEGTDPRDVLEAAREAMGIIGLRFECKDYFLPELILGGEILQGIAEIVKPRLGGAAEKAEPRGRVLIGTVAGDIHDIGKDIVAFMLECNRFEVQDLGVDVPPERFVEEIRRNRPQVVGLSGFLTLAFDQMKATVGAIAAAGLRESVKIMIGGAPMDDAAAQYVGADAYGSDATAAVRLAQGWTEGV